jgi:hypothetical protein
LKALADLVAEKMGINSPLTKLDPENVDKLLRCLRESMQYFSAPVNSDKYVHHLITNVFPHLDAMVPEVVHLKIEIYKLFAELTIHTSPDYVTKFPEDLEAIYRTVLELLILPPTLDETALEVPVNPDETPLDDDDGPNLGLSQIECFLFAFHRLLQRAPEFFVERKENGEKVR